MPGQLLHTYTSDADTDADTDPHTGTDISQR
jgi:hypothetical protein